MNFIDKALAEKDNMSGDDFLQAMADIYSEPQIWEQLTDYPQYIQDIVYIIDYDTMMQMEGLEGFFEAGRNFTETYQALLNCGARTEAEILKQAETISFDDENYSEQYRHLESQTALENDYEGFWKHVADYIERNIR